MQLHTEPLPGDPTLRAALYGPLVLAADLGPGPTDGPLKIGHRRGTAPRTQNSAAAAADPGCTRRRCADWIEVVSRQGPHLQVGN